MANYTKREESRATMAELLDAGLRPRIELPRCHCGALAAVCAYTQKGNFYFCAEHEHGAEALI